MRNFNQGNKFGKRRDFGGRDSRRSPMYQATCDECGQNCEVPFQPTSGKPIYCSQCFKNKGGKDDKRFRGGDSSRRDFGGRDSRRSSMYQAVCDECGQNCEVPFQPTSGKPIYCSQCFKKDHGKKNQGGSEQSSKQFDVLNKKLDQILKVLAPNISIGNNQEKKAAEKIEISKPKKVAKKTAIKKKAVAKGSSAKKTKKKK